MKVNQWLFILNIYYSLVEAYTPEGLLIQIELFNKYGFVHNDIHLGNILLKKEKDPVTFNFIFNNEDIEITTNKILVLTDFDESWQIKIFRFLFDTILYYKKSKIFYNNESLIISKDNRKVMLQSDKCKYIDTLESNIYNTFSMAIELLESEKEKYDLSRILNKNTNDKNESCQIKI